MAIKRKLIECECGEQFVEGSGHQMSGNVKLGPWRFVNHRLRSAKSPSGGDVLAALFERSVGCGRCGFEFIREKRQYDITPPVNPNKPEPIPSFGSREFVVASVSPPSSTKMLDASQEQIVLPFRRGEVENS